MRPVALSDTALQDFLPSAFRFFAPRKSLGSRRKAVQIEAFSDDKRGDQSRDRNLESGHPPTH